MIQRSKYQMCAKYQTIQCILNEAYEYRIIKKKKEKYKQFMVNTSGELACSSLHHLIFLS